MKRRGTAVATSSPEPAPMRGRQWLLVSCACVAAAFAVFSPSLMSEAFVSDADSPLRLSLVSHVKHVPTIFGGDFMVATDGQYRPLGYAVLAVARTFVPAEWTPFWHSWLVAFHALNAVLVWALVRRLTRHPAAAAAAGAVFLLHPLTTVFANQMARFHQVLGAAMFLGTFLLYTEFARTGRRRLYALMLPLFAAGLFTSKAVATLPVVLVLYELGYRRTGFLRALGRPAPFAALVLLMVPCWTLIGPNTLQYVYPAFDPGVGWYSFASVVAAAPLMALGFLGGWGVPAPLAELAPHLTVALHWTFLVSFVALAGVSVLAVRGLKRPGLGLGFLFMVATLIPYSTTELNHTDEFVSWGYLYLPLAGFALLAGGGVDVLMGSLEGARRRVAAGCVTAVAALFAAVLVMNNLASRSTELYWTRVLAMNPRSETASVALGCELLAKGDEQEGIRRLFSGGVARLAPSCTAAARYYARRGDTLAAGLHLRFCIDAPGATFDETNQTLAAMAEVTQALGALDWTEDSLAQIVTRNPYEAETQAVLAQLMSEKGYARAAARMMRRAVQLEPGRADFRRALAALERRQYRTEPAPAILVVTPQPPERLQYAVGRPITARLRQSVIQLADLHPDDPVIQLEAGIQMAQEGQKGLAFDRLVRASNALQRYPYAWAARCWIARELGKDDEALAAAVYVLRLGPLDARLRQNILHNLGYLLDRKGLLGESAAYYRAALRESGAALGRGAPQSDELHNSLAGVLMRLGRFDEALVHLERAAALGLNTPSVENNMGHALLRLNRPDDALGHFRRAVELDATDVRTHRGLGGALLSLGRFDEARTAYTRGLDRFPDDELTLGMTIILSAAPEANLRDGPRAVRLAEAACRKTQDPPAELLDALAAAYAETGRFGEAQATARRALSAAPAQGKTDLTRDIDARLRLYQAGKPYRLAAPR